MDAFGKRLKEERLESGLTQEKFASIGGVAVRAQQNYESGNRSPDAEYFAKIAKIGVDINYIITGNRNSHPFFAAAHYTNVSEEAGAYDVKSHPKIDRLLLAEIMIAVEEIVASHVLSARWDITIKANVVALLYKNYSAAQEKPRRDDPALKAMIEVLLGPGWG